MGAGARAGRGASPWGCAAAVLHRAQPFFLSPGLPSFTDSKFVKMLRELKDSERTDRIPLIPSTPEEMADMLKLCSYVRFKVPQQVRNRERDFGAAPRICPAAPSLWASLLPSASAGWNSPA